MVNSIDIRRHGTEFHTKIDWLNSYHSFSFGPHYDPGNTHHGLLLVSNDDVIKADTGFQTHPHQDMEIVTWVISGELEHRDSEGNHGILYPGLAQRMTAGRGIWHSEINPSKKDDVRLVQMWVPPDRDFLNPGYEQLDISKELGKGGLIPVASGRDHHAAIRIHQKDAVLWAGRLKKGETVSIPNAPYVHLYITKGSAELEGAGELKEKDAVRLTSAGSPKLTAHSQTGAELLVWESHTSL